MELHRSRVPGGMPGIGHVIDATELRVWEVVLRGSESGGPQLGIVGAKIRREDVDVPTFDQVNAGRTLIHHLQDVVVADLVFDGCVPVHHITWM